MVLLEQIEADLKTALKAGEADKLSTLRLLKNSLDAAAKEKNPPVGGDLDDYEVTKVIQKEIKQRRDSIEGYKQGSRDDLAQKEAKEIEVLEKYLPEQMDEGQLEQIIDGVIAKTGASSMADMGKVMGLVNSQVAGQADSSKVAQLVRSKLGS